MRMSPINSIARYCIEFSSLILLVVILLLMHGIGEATYAKHVKISNNPSKTNTISDKTLDFGFETDIEDDILRFIPDSIDFGKSEIGKPLIETVQVHNSHDEKTIQMISITGSSPFYCSFIEETILEPRSNTTITVAFLARQEGLVNNTLLVHSNVGLSRIRLFGYGEPSPFRVRPLIGGKVLLNSTYSSVIYLYNPFPTPIQLTEVYSSGANLQLELLDNNGDKNEKTNHNGNDKSLGHWNIPPYEYRPIMKTNFAGKIVSNYTSFIRIHLNSSEETQLVLPVEIEVCSKPGLYSTTSILDFGTIIPQQLNSLSLPSLNIEVINTDPRSLTVESIEFEGLSHGAQIDFKGPVIVIPNPSKAVVLGRLVLDNQNTSCLGNCASKVIIKIREKGYKPLSVDFVMNVVEGELSFPEYSTSYMRNSFSMEHSTSLTSSKPFSLTNRFSFPIVISRITSRSTSNNGNFVIDNCPSLFDSDPKHVLLQPQESFSIGSRLRMDNLNNKNLSCDEKIFYVMVKTNLTDFHIPIHFVWNCFNVYVPGNSEPLMDKWNLGVVSSSESISTFFILMNDRNVSLTLGKKSPDPKVNSELVGSIDSANLPLAKAVLSSLSDLEQFFTPTLMDDDEKSVIHSLPAHHFGVFRFLHKPSGEGEHRISVPVEIVNFDSLNIPIKIAVSDGKIVAEKAILSKTFPGRVVSTQLNIKSYNSVPVRVKRISLETNDKRFKIDVPPGYVLQPGDNTEAKVTFDPSAICPPLVCYASLDIEKEVGHFWLLGHGVYSDTAYIDKELYKLVRNQWMTHSELDLAPSASFRFHTDGFGSFNTEVQAQLHWPRLSNKFALKFPALRVGRKLVKDIVIENPADKPIIVQAVHVAHYPNADVLLQMMQSIIFHKQWASSDIEAIEKTILDSNNLSAFGFATSSAQGLKLTDANRVYDWLGVKPSPESFTMLLPPGSRQRLGVTFRPLVERNFTSLLILRNNLTVIEVVVLRGEGGIGMLKIDSHAKARNPQIAGNLETSLSSSSSSSLFSSSTGDNLQAESSKIIFEFPKATLDRLCLYSPYTSEQNDEETLLNDDDEEYSSFSLQASGKNKFLIRHRFKATNIGRMGLQIRHFFIDSLPCEGFGFQVKNCEPIQLQPNQSFDLEMTYSPDFTQTQVKHNLILLLDDEFTQWQRFELIVSIPSDYLSSCLAALPRPAWEGYVGRCLFLITTFLIILTVFVAYTDATKLVSGYGFSLSDTESNTDDDSQSVFDDDDSKPIVNGNGQAHSNGSLHHNGTKSLNNKLKQRKNAKIVQQTQPVKKNRPELNSTSSSLRDSKSDIKQFCDENIKHKLNHQNSSSSENESFSETSSSNRQSTESLCDIPVSSRKNSMDNEQQRGKENKEKSNENGKKKKNKYEWKKLDVGKTEMKNESMQSLFFPPIEEFDSMIKTRSATHPGQKAKVDDKKKKAETKSSDSGKTVPKKSTDQIIKSFGRDYKEPAKNAWNCDNSITDIWKQPSNLTNDIFNFPVHPPKRQENGSLSKSNDKWIVGEWSNDFASKSRQNQCHSSNSNHLSQQEQSLRGYFGLRFDSGRKSPSLMKTTISNNNKFPEPESDSPFFPANSSGWLSNPTPTSSIPSVWEQRNTQSPLSSTSSSQNFSPIIAPPKSTSPSSSTVQQIAQQDQYFQQRSRAPQVPQTSFGFGDSSRLDFNDFINREPLFMENASAQRISRIAPPPGFSNPNPIDNNLSWLSTPFPTTSRPGTENISRHDGFESNSIWNSTDSNLDRWPTQRTTTTPELGADSFWRHESEQLFDHRSPCMDWLSADRRQPQSPSDFLGSSSSTWGFSSLPPNLNSQSQTLSQNGDALRKSLNASSPSPSSSSSSNGRNN